MKFNESVQQIVLFTCREWKDRCTNCQSVQPLTPLFFLDFISLPDHVDFPCFFFALFLPQNIPCLVWNTFHLCPISVHIKYLLVERCSGLCWLLLALIPGLRSWGSPEFVLGGVWQGIFSLSPKFGFPPLTVFLCASPPVMGLGEARAECCVHRFLHPPCGGMLCGCEDEVLSYNRTLLAEAFQCLYFMDLFSCFKIKRQLCEFTCHFLCCS